MIQDDLRLLRIRTKKHELIITPGELELWKTKTNMSTLPEIGSCFSDDKYLLVVLQDPS